MYGRVHSGALHKRRMSDLRCKWSHLHTSPLNSLIWIAVLSVTFITICDTLKIWGWDIFSLDSLFHPSTFHTVELLRWLRIFCLPCRSAQLALKLLFWGKKKFKEKRYRNSLHFPTFVRYRYKVVVAPCIWPLIFGPIQHRLFNDDYLNEMGLEESYLTSTIAPSPTVSSIVASSTLQTSDSFKLSTIVFQETSLPRLDPSKMIEKQYCQEFGPITCSTVKLGLVEEPGIPLGFHNKLLIFLLFEWNDRGIAWWWRRFHGVPRWRLVRIAHHREMKMASSSSTTCLSSSYRLLKETLSNQR